MGIESTCFSPQATEPRRTPSSKVRYLSLIMKTKRTPPAYRVKAPSSSVLHPVRNRARACAPLRGLGAGYF